MRPLQLAGTVKFYPGSIPVEARDWVGRFQENKDGALAELFEFILRVRGRLMIVVSAFWSVERA